MLDLSALLLLSASQTIGGLVLTAWTAHQGRGEADRAASQARIKLRILLISELEALAATCRDNLDRLSSRQEQPLLPLDPFLRLYHTLLPQMGAFRPIEFAHIVSVYSLAEQLRRDLGLDAAGSQNGRDPFEVSDLRTRHGELIAGVASVLNSMRSGRGEDRL